MKNISVWEMSFLFAGSTALLLWGTHMVQTGVQRAFGARLRAVLAVRLSNRLYAFVAGLGVTALLQSSTATGLMVANFAASEIVGLVEGLAIMLGANLGSTLIVQALSFDVSALSPILLVVGVFVFRKNYSARSRDLSRASIGLGLMLLALHQLLLVLSSVSDAPGTRVLASAISTAPVLGVILGAAVAWAAHSSAAMVLLVMSLAAQNVISPEAAFVLVLGANLGASINPVLEGPKGGDGVSKRVPVGIFLARFLGVVLAVLAMRPIAGFMVSIEPDMARAVADFHTAFNLCIAGACLPLLTPYSRLLCLLFPKRRGAVDPSVPLYLDASAREVPIVAIGGAAREALRLADVLENMLVRTNAAFASGDRRIFAEIQKQDDVLDNLNRSIKAYATSLDPDDLGISDNVRLHEVLAFTMNMEQAGDVVDRCLLPHAQKCFKRGLALSDAQRLQLTTMIARLANNVRTAASLLVTASLELARSLTSEKIAFRDVESAAIVEHLCSIQTGEPIEAQTSALYLDLLRDLKLINSHIVSAAAYPVLERTGQLLPTRIPAEI